MSWSPLDPDDPQDEMVVGDEAWDVMFEAVREVVRLYQRDFGRLPHSEEVVRTFQDVLQPSWSELVSEGQTTELTEIRAKVKKIAKWQNYRVGDILRAIAANGQAIYARVFEPGDLMGKPIGVYDSLGMPPDDLDAIISRPLIVKITPIHHELMEKRAWVVIGYRPITDLDRKHPRGPDALSGQNDQLIAANYHYKLSEKKFYDIDRYLVSERDDT